MIIERDPEGQRDEIRADPEAYLASLASERMDAIDGQDLRVLCDALGLALEGSDENLRWRLHHYWKEQL